MADQVTFPAEDRDYRFFLGGHDLEMIEIRRLLEEAGLGDRITDFGLRWGARASAYENEIAASLAKGETSVLIELADDLPAALDRAQIVVVDHHRERAGQGAPSSLRQIYHLAGEPSGVPWTRWRSLVEANDIGHLRALRALGATTEEVRVIRDADRAAQGIGAAIEAESHRAVSMAKRHGALTVVHTTAPTSSAITDFIEPEYGGPGADDLVVVMPDKVAFFGHGFVIEDLKSVPGCWYGGALPEYGFWGAPEHSVEVEQIIARVAALLG